MQELPVYPAISFVISFLSPALTCLAALRRDQVAQGEVVDHVLDLFDLFTESLAI